jgi:hypothetical protein
MRKISLHANFVGEKFTACLFLPVHYNMLFTVNSDGIVAFLCMQADEFEAIEIL